VSSVPRVYPRTQVGLAWVARGYWQNLSSVRLAESLLRCHFSKKRLLTDRYSRCVAIEYLRSLSTEEAVQGKVNPVLMVYCRYNEPLTPQDILRCLILQLLESHEQKVFAAIEREYKKHASQEGGLSQSQALALLITLVESFPQVRIVIDALDEIRNEERQSALLSALAQLPAQILLFSRPLELCLDYMPSAVMISVEAREEDIERFVIGKVDENPKLRRIIGSKPAILKEVTEKIKAKARGVYVVLYIPYEVARKLTERRFLIAALQLGELAECATLKTIQRALSTFPSDINAMYDHTLKRIVNSKSEEEIFIAKMALLWTARACRPLFLQELKEAIATSCRVGNLELGEFDVRAVPEGDLIVSLCCGLLVMDKTYGQVMLMRELNYRSFKLFSTVNKFDAIDETTQSFILSHRSAPFTDSVEIAMMATIIQCLHPGSEISSLANFAEDWSLSAQESFMTYAHEYWPEHAEQFASMSQPKRPLRNLLSEMCMKWGLPHPGILFETSADGVDNTGPNSTAEAHQHYCPFAEHITDTPCLFLLWFLHTQSPLLAETAWRQAVEHGNAAAVKLLLQTSTVDPNTTSTYYSGLAGLRQPPEDGAPQICKPLLRDNQVNTEIVDKKRMTALHHACEYGQLEVVKALLADQRVEPNGLDDNVLGSSPLSAACTHRQLHVVAALLDDERVNVNSPNRLGETALMSAAKRGQDGVARALLASSRVEVNQVDIAGLTALTYASFLGHPRLVELLLDDHRVDPCAADLLGKTPFLSAVEWGRLDIVKIFLQRGTDPNTRDLLGRSPLMLVSEAMSGKDHFSPLVETEEEYMSRHQATLDFLLAQPNIDREGLPSSSSSTITLEVSPS